MTGAWKTGWRAWAGLVVSPLAWFVHHQAGSDLNFTDCQVGDGSLVVTIGVCALIVALAGGLLSWSAWRARDGVVDRTNDPPGRFIAALGAMSGVLFSLTIGMQIAAGLIVPACFP